MKNRLKVALLTSTALFLILPTANAAFLVGTSPLGNTQTIFTTLPVVPGTPAGTLLASTTAPYSFSTTSGTTSGTLTSAVYNNGGTLDFYYQVANSANSATAIARETDNSFTGFATQVGFRTDGGSFAAAGFVNGSITPITADKNGSGSVVGFQFNPPDGAKILPGTTSSVLVISTNATAFVLGNASVIDGGTQTVTAYQPAGVPEPVSMILMGTGLLALAGVRRFKKSA